MSILYLDCGMGAAGDMLAAALWELHPDREDFVRRFQRLFPEIEMRPESSVKCGITGTHIRMLIDGVEEQVHDHAHSHEEQGHTHAHHTHHSLQDIEKRIQALPLTEKIKADICAVYRLIAEAEGTVHGAPVTQIHFHEVGTLDALADVTAVCMLLSELSPAEIIASPVATGFGSVRCAHGILPVPAPATALLLKDIPTYAGAFEGELCTPTGAALLRHFVTQFAQCPAMRVKKIGYGMGTKDFPRMNGIRAQLGEALSSEETVVELTCSLDDMTGEELGFASERLFEAGALEVYTIPISMKKSRPGIELCVLCRKESKETVLRTMFHHTTTLGIRENDLTRHTLARKIREVETPCGTLHEKCSEGYGTTRKKLEYEDLARFAAERGLSLYEVRELLMSAPEE